MTTLEIIIIILGILVVILGFTTFNLLRKNEKQEDSLLANDEYFDKLNEIIEFSQKRLKELDQRGAFEGDDEVGFIFREIKKIQELISQFKLR